MFPKLFKIKTAKLHGIDYRILAYMIKHQVKILSMETIRSTPGGFTFVLIGLGRLEESETIESLGVPKEMIDKTHGALAQYLNDDGVCK
jgi:hypothetical protein